MQSMINRGLTNNWIVKYMTSRGPSTTSMSAEQRKEGKDREASLVISTGRVPHRFQNSQVLLSEISNGTSKGLKVRRSIVATGRIYPLVRVKETIALDPTTGEEEVIDVLAVVADHIRVTLRPGASEFNLQSLNQKLDGRLRKYNYPNGSYLVSFPNPDVHSETSALIAYNRESVVVP